jgi:hypothetical protein
VAIAQYSGPIRIAVGSGKSPAMTGLRYAGGSSAGAGDETAAKARTLPVATRASRIATAQTRLAVMDLFRGPSSDTVSDPEPGVAAEVPARKAS